MEHALRPNGPSSRASPVRKLAGWTGGLWVDVRHAWRTLTRKSHYASLAVLTTAFSTGLVTAMCAVLDGTLWHPLPFPDADRLVALSGPVSPPTVAEWAAAASFGGVAGYKTHRYTATGAGDATSVKATIASSNLFDVLGSRAVRGRAFDPSDDATGARPAVLGDEAWRTTFQADPAIVGKTIYLNRIAFTIIGVMPAGFQFPTTVERVDLYTTVAADLQTDRRAAASGGPRDLLVVARLKPGVGVERARAEMAVLLTGEGRAAPHVDPRGLVVPLARDVAREMVSPLAVLTGAVACVLAMACATVAILTLIQVTGRRDELMTRLAVGATRARLAQQAVIEGLLVAGVGGALGAAVAVFGAGPLLAAAGPEVTAAAHLDAGVVALSFGISLAAACLAAVAPATRAAATAWPSRTAAQGTRDRSVSTNALRGVLVSVEVALMVVLVALCVSLLRGYLGLSHVDPGFETSGVMTFRVDLSDAMKPLAQQAEVFERVRATLDRTPGVQAGAFTALLPFGDLRFTMRLGLPHADSPHIENLGIEVHLVSPGFFGAMKIPVVEGRGFDASDVDGRPRVAVVSRSLAARVFPGVQTVGQPLDLPLGRSDGSDRFARVVGVVGDIRNGTLSAPPDPQVYVPYSQAPLAGSVTFVARIGENDPSRIMAAVRRHVREIDASMPLVNQRPLEDYVDRSLVRPRFNVLLTGVFAATAVFLAIAGLYAVVSYSTMGRRWEFAIRKALGATDWSIAGLVVRHGLRSVAAGLVAGMVGAAGTLRLLARVLYGVQPGQVVTLGVAAATAVVVTLAAVWVPARTAARDTLRGFLRDQT